MIVLLDANPVIADRFFTSLPRVIFTNPEYAWTVDIRIPRVSFLEAVAHTERQLDEAASTLKKMNRNLDGIPVLQEARDELIARRGQVGEDLAKAAHDVGVTIVDPPDVPHLDIVQRQVNRVRPCKQSTGDGYRDTLNWLTVLDTAASNPGTPVVWVSEDGDFTNSSGELHPDLVAEAEAAGIADRITLHTNTGALAIELLRANGLSHELPKARRELCERTVWGYVWTLLPDQLVDSNAPGLASLSIVECEHAGEIEVEHQGQVEPGSVWAFRAPVQLTLAGLENMFVEATVSGLVTVDQRDRPTGGEITNVRSTREQLTRAVENASWSDPTLAAAAKSIVASQRPPSLATLRAEHTSVIDQIFASSLATMDLTPKINAAMWHSPVLDSPIIRNSIGKNPLLQGPVFDSPLFDSRRGDKRPTEVDRHAGNEDPDEGGRGDEPKEEA